jgi:ABC-type transport system involved in cytochrome bd biosynthesis fused ATPase/permease subunit
MAQILVELVKFANTIFTVNKALACAHRIETVLDTPSGMEGGSVKTEELPLSDTAVSFRNVSLTYAGNAEPSIERISFEVPRGATVGIIGSTGSGKTSVVNLIPRFYDATEGQVLVDGKYMLVSGNCFCIYFSMVWIAFQLAKDRVACLDCRVVCGNRCRDRSVFKGWGLFYSSL